MTPEWFSHFGSAEALAAGSGILLLGIGAYYQLFRQRLKSDPVLIATCYLWGGFNLATCVL